MKFRLTFLAIPFFPISTFTHNSYIRGTIKRVWLLYHHHEKKTFSCKSCYVDSVHNRTYILYLSIPRKDIQFGVQNILSKKISIFGQLVYYIYFLYNIVYLSAGAVFPVTRQTCTYLYFISAIVLQTLFIVAAAIEQCTFYMCMHVQIYIINMADSCTSYVRVCLKGGRLSR